MTRLFISGSIKTNFKARTWFGWTKIEFLKGYSTPNDDFFFYMTYLYDQFIVLRPRRCREVNFLVWKRFITQEESFLTFIRYLKCAHKWQLVSVWAARWTWRCRFKPWFFAHCTFHYMLICTAKLLNKILVCKIFW